MNRLVSLRSDFTYTTLFEGSTGEETIWKVSINLIIGTLAFSVSGGRQQIELFESPYRDTVSPPLNDNF